MLEGFPITAKVQLPEEIPKSTLLDKKLLKQGITSEIIRVLIDFDIVARDFLSCCYLFNTLLF